MTITLPTILDVNIYLFDLSHTDYAINKTKLVPPMSFIDSL